MPRKPISPYKLAALPEWQQQRIKADEAKAKSAQVQGSSLKTFSPKRLAKLGSRTMYSTFAPKPGAKPLRHQRLVEGKTVKEVATKGWRFDREHLLNKGKPLRLLGVRGRRLAPKDKAARQEIAGLPCVCGCNRPTVWIHLKTRSSEAERHLPWVTVPGCTDLDFWLDQGPGAGVKSELYGLAKAEQRRLTEADVSPYLVGNAYYTWLYEKRRII